MYFLSPRNRYLLVEEKHVTINKQEERSFVLPTDYKEKREPYKIMRVVEDASSNYTPETLILVPTNVLEEVEINEQKFYLVTDNYILAVVNELED